MLFAQTFQHSVSPLLQYVFSLYHTLSENKRRCFFTESQRTKTDASSRSGDWLSLYFLFSTIVFSIATFIKSADQNGIFANFLKNMQTKSSGVFLHQSFFGGRGWTSRAAHLKKPRRGFFTRRTVRRVDAVRIHPCVPFFKADKTETPVPGSDTGVLGGRGWIRTTEAEKQQIYSLSPLATREHAQIQFTVVNRLLIYVTIASVICQLFFHLFLTLVSNSQNHRLSRWLE